jgi:hypothetical protein
METPVQRSHRSAAGRLPRAAALCAGFGAALALAAAASARSTTNPTLYVFFSASGLASVSTGDGRTIDTSKAAPTVIPAGYYTLLFQDGGECIPLPYFHLSGPGVDVVTTADSGAENRLPTVVHLLPTSTYSWVVSATPGVVYRFSTSSQVVGSPPPAPARSPGTFTSTDIVGSGLHPFVGSLSATIAANGKVTLLQAGKPLRKLKPGRYSVTVVSHDPHSGFAIERLANHTVTVARGAFSGKRLVSVRLTPGKWIFLATPGKASSSFVVA